MGGARIERTCLRTTLDDSGISRSSRARNPRTASSAAWSPKNASSALNEDVSASTEFPSRFIFVSLGRRGARGIGSSVTSSRVDRGPIEDERDYL